MPAWKPVQAKQAGSAHFIGTYCKRDLPLIGYVQELVFKKEIKYDCFVVKKNIIYDV